MCLRMTSSNDSLAGIAANLAQARTEAAKLVDDPNASDDDIKTAAYILGGALLAVAGKDDLWSRGTTKPDGVDANQWNRLLTALRNVDWDKHLGQKRDGYQPLPDKQASQAAEAI